jgi:hypothetical protein
MNVSLTSHGIGSSPLTGAAKTASVDPVALEAGQSRAASNARRPATAARRSEFAARQEQLNRQATRAQCSIAFLDGAQAALQELKTTLGGSLATRPATSAALEAPLARVQAQWQSRHAATGGALGPDLSFHDDGDAAQSFRIHALTLDTLSKAHAEVLTIYPRGSGKPAVSLLIDGQPRSDRDWARRIDHALAASGISAAVNEERELTFNTRESRWHELRGQLMIQGNGHRFPGGRPSPASTEATAAPIEPAHWRIDSATEKRATLRQVVQAIEHVQLVREGLQRLLQQNAAAAHSDGHALGRHGAATIATSFGHVLEQTADFQRFATIGAALRGLNEHRVRCVSTT